MLAGMKCYMGLDLSSTTDLTALTLLFPPQDGLEHWTALFDCWIPEDSMKEREKRDHVPFQAWVHMGKLHATAGDAVDYDHIEQRILDYNACYRVEAMGVDPWNSRMLTQRLMQAGMDIVEIPQNMAGMSPAMKDMERLMRSKAMTHEETPVGRWCFGNVRVTTDGNENIKPMKNKSIDRIDMTVSWIIATAMARSRTSMATGVYEYQAPRMIRFDD
jgi:phage terminase large subunit-like protein